MKRYLTVTVFLFVFSVFLHSQETAFTAVAPYSDLLGLTPEAAIERLGVPSEMFSFRGDREDLDNVVFFYADHIYLFWLDNRVWQVRLDERFTDPEGPSLMGLTSQEIIRIMGEPVHREVGLLLYDLPDRGYPVRGALYFDEENHLMDLYIYRSDL